MTLIDKVLKQIKEDVAMGDMTAIEELLTGLVRHRTKFLLSDYLSEESEHELPEPTTE